MGVFGRITKEVWAKAEDHVLKLENIKKIIGKHVMYNLSFTTGVPVQSVIMLDWIQLSSSLDSSSSKSIIIGGISLLSMQFSFPYSFSNFNTS
jgi:hypothetical protein